MEHWSSYWKHGEGLSSFAEGEAGSGYTGVIKDHWDAKFASFPKQATIVDIGTGNGALALLARHYSETNKVDFAVHAIDAAKVDPLAHVKTQSAGLVQALQSIQFHSETPIEKVPFKASSVDAYISQFGFEYADTEKAITKMLATLKAEGRAELMVHHQDSQIVQGSKTGIEVLTRVLEDSPLFQLADLYIDLAAQAIPQLGEDGWKDFSHQRILTRSLQWMMEELKQQYSGADTELWITDIISRVARVLANVSEANIDKNRKHLAYEYQLLEAHRLRLTDQLNAAMNSEQIEALIAFTKRAGAKASAEVFNENGKALAWSLSISK